MPARSQVVPSPPPRCRKKRGPPRKSPENPTSSFPTPAPNELQKEEKRTKRKKKISKKLVSLPCLHYSGESCSDFVHWHSPSILQHHPGHSFYILTDPCVDLLVSVLGRLPLTFKPKLPSALSTFTSGSATIGRFSSPTRRITPQSAPRSWPHWPNTSPSSPSATSS